MGWITLIVCVFIALVMYACCAAEKQAEEAEADMRLKRLLLDSERLTEAAIASDVGRRRGFKDGYEACRDEITEKMKEVEDRPKGEWREERNWRNASFYSVCSECGYFDDERDDLTAYNYCPYCGADMRGEDND